MFVASLFLIRIESGTVAFLDGLLIEEHCTPKGVPASHRSQIYKHLTPPE